MDTYEPNGELSEDVLDELSPIVIAAITEVTEGDTRVSGDEPDDNVVWGNR